MARGVIDRRVLRDQAEAAEALKPEEKEKKPKAVKAKAAPRSRAKVKAEVRNKLYWAVFNHNLKRVAVFEYDQKPDAEARAAELTKSSSSHHFIQKIKEAVV